MIVLSLLFSMTCRQAQAAPAPGKHLLIETKDGDNGDENPLSDEYVEVYPLQHPGHDYQHPGHQDPLRFG